MTWGNDGIDDTYWGFSSQIIFLNNPKTFHWLRPKIFHWLKVPSYDHHNVCGIRAPTFSSASYAPDRFEEKLKKERGGGVTSFFILNLGSINFCLRPPHFLSASYALECIQIICTQFKNTELMCAFRSIRCMHTKMYIQYVCTNVHLFEWCITKCSWHIVHLS